MNDERRQRAEVIFHDLADLPPGEQEEALAARCGDDEELRAFVERLLDVDSVGTDDVLRPIAYRTDEDDEADEMSSRVPERIGQYDIIRKIGEGGMGTVFEARQETPRRTVALKILRPGLASRSLLWRFRHEADFLGQLQHPGIAQVYEAGVADVIVSVDGAPVPALRQPFFAMEFIRGVPLTDYADANNLDKRRRLELIARVCDAVQHAHQKGVIHRDLKPTNILVADDTEAASDADPSSWSTAGSLTVGSRVGQPKILDFGVARATNSDVHTVTMQTGVGQLVGTIPYMSPEQVIGDSNQMDTRSDVYALGVILYECLSGTLPHDVQDLSIPEATRKIRDEEPRRLGSLDRALRGEIETIVARALEKDRTRRYQSAFDLAADIRRYLRGEAIEAKRDSKVYVLKKALGRNKLATAGVLALAITVTGAAAALGVLYHKQTLANEEALQARIEAEVSANSARKEAAVSRAAVDFLQRTLSSADPRQEKGPDYTIREALVQAAKRVEEDFSDQPDVEAAIRSTIGITCQGLGMMEQAEPHLRAALRVRRDLHDGDHLDLAESIYQMGSFEHQKGNHEDAKRLSAQALAMQTRLLGSENRTVAKSLRLFGMCMKELTEVEAADSLLSEALALDRRLDGGRHEGVLESLNELAYVKMIKGENEACRRLLEESLDLTRELTGEDHLPFARQAGNLAALLTSMGDHAAAEPLIRKSIAIRLAKLDEDHPDVGSARIVLARLLQAKGEFDEAASVHREVLASDRKTLPAGHPYLAGDLINLADTLDRLGEHTEAEALYREALEIQLSQGRDEHPRTLTAMMGLGRCLMEQGRLDEAEPLLRDALDSRRRLIGEENPSTLIAMNDLANLLHQQGKHAKAEQLFKDALGGQRAILGDDNPQTLTTAHNLARLLIDTGALDEAESLHRGTVDGRRRMLGETHPHTLMSISLLDRLLVEQRRSETVVGPGATDE